MAEKESSLSCKYFLNSFILFYNQTKRYWYIFFSQIRSCCSMRRRALVLIFCSYCLFNWAWRTLFSSFNLFTLYYLREEARASIDYLLMVRVYCRSLMNSYRRTFSVQRNFIFLYMLSLLRRTSQILLTTESPFIIVYFNQHFFV